MATTNNRTNGPILMPDSFASPTDVAPEGAIRGLLPRLSGPAGAKPIRAILRARGRRGEYIDPAVFGEPAWDMLLELYAAEIEQKRISITSLCLASGVPGTTALRWIDVLASKHLVNRRNDPLDGRRVFVSLSTNGLNAMFAYFAGGPLELD